MTLIPPSNRLDELGFLRLKEVLRLYPVSKSVWWDGVKNGRFPQPVKLSKRVTAWRAVDIETLLIQKAHQDSSFAQDSADHDATFGPHAPNDFNQKKI